MKVSLLTKEFYAILRLSIKYFWQSRLRFILLPSVFILLKIIGTMWLAQRFSERGFLSFFHGWDSGWYIAVASSWYPPVASEKWAFFPFYPICSYLVNLILHDIRLSTALISLIVGIAWIPIFQAIAEKYMDTREAFTSTFIFALFPQVFLFTTIAYSESIFIFTTLTSWFLFLRRNTSGSCVFASFATLSRPYGILIILPIFLGLVSKRLWKKIPLISLPIATFLGWILYSFVKTEDYLAFITAQKHWIGLGQPVNWFREFLLPQFASAQYTYTYMHPLTMSYYLLPFIAIVAYLVIMSFEVDWRLGIYGMTALTTILYFGTPISVSRFLPFIFPIWLNTKIRNPFILIALCVFFYLHALVIWYLFCSRVWMG